MEDWEYGGKVGYGQAVIRRRTLPLWRVGLRVAHEELSKKMHGE